MTSARTSVLKWSLFIAFVVLLSESASYVFFIVQPLLQSREDKRWRDTILRRDGIDPELMAKEMQDLYTDRVRFHPYRWFALPANFRGKYITTDGSGFRVDPLQVRPGTRKMAFFGGSAMFSVMSNDGGTIPALVDHELNPDVVQPLNFGLGGYSSSAELTTFVEAIRGYDHISHAIFYDGYNEIVRYVERLQDHAGEPYYDRLGYFFLASLRPAMESLIADKDTTFAYTPQTLRLGKGILRRLRGTRTISVLVTDADIPRHAAIIADIYLRNVRDIVAIAEEHDITPIFFWQPDIGSTTRKPFTEHEVTMKAGDPVVRKLCAAVRAILVQRSDLAASRWFDLSDALDDLDGRPHFHDPVHVSVDANRLVARKIVSSVRPFVPDAYWNRDRQR